MAILRATLLQVVAEQQTVNRWYYISTGDPGGSTSSFALAQVMGPNSGVGDGTLLPGTPLQALSALQQANTEYVSLLVEDLYTLSNFYELVYEPDTDGLVVAGQLAPFNAFGFRTTRVTRAIRRGYKRFPGVPETSVESAGTITAVVLAQMETLATRMSNPLTYTEGGANITFEPAILSFEEYTTPAGNRAYQQYATEAEQLENAATGFLWEPYTVVRSQVSRQRGRGN